MRGHGPYLWYRQRVRAVIRGQPCVPRRHRSHNRQRLVRPHVSTPQGRNAILYIYRHQRQNAHGRGQLGLGGLGTQGGLKRFVCPPGITGAAIRDTPESEQRHLPLGGARSRDPGGLRVTQLPIVKPNPEERPPRLGEPQAQNLEARCRRAWRWPKPLALNPDSTSDVPKKLRGLPAPQLQDYPAASQRSQLCLPKISSGPQKGPYDNVTCLVFPSSHVDMDVADF